MSENLLNLTGLESYHEVLIARTSIDPDIVENQDDLAKALEAVKAERGLPLDSKDPKLGSDGQHLSALASKLDSLLKGKEADIKRVRKAVNGMVSKATLTKPLTALLTPKEDGQ
jgi:hypothetical protein